MSEVTGLLSVVIPAWNEEAMIAKTAQTVSSILEENKVPFEIMFVDDGSKDKTWEEIQKASRAIPQVRGVRFSRNFGKESAMFAGLGAAGGDCVAVMDCDLQHPPEKLVEMYHLWQQGYEVIEGVKSDRGKESGLHALCVRIFYDLISYSSGFDMSRASDFKLLDRKAVNVILNIREKNAFFRALSSWVGFKTTQVEFEVQERQAGVSKWSTMALVRYAITNITSFTNAPMMLVAGLGVLMFLASVILGIIAISQKVSGTALNGFTTVILLELFIGSIVMLSLGIIGYYISRIYEEVKGRPRYIIAENCGEGIKNQNV